MAVLLFKIISNYIEIVNQVLLYLTTATGIKRTKNTWIKVKFICTLIFMPLKPPMEPPIDLIAFEHYFGHFFEALSSFYNMQQPVASNDCTTSCSFIFRPFLSAGMTQL